MIRLISYGTFALGLGAATFAAWLHSLPRLDPTGREDAGPAVRAMIECRIVRGPSGLVIPDDWPCLEWKK